MCSANGDDRPGTQHFDRGAGSGLRRVAGGLDAALQFRGGLLAYHSALKQTSSDVAVMLFVTSIEVLISQRQGWRKQKVTQRFVKSPVERCPQAVDELRAHSNVKEAFAHRKKGGVNRQRRELLERIYETRSTPTGIGSRPRFMSPLTTRIPQGLPTRGRASRLPALRDRRGGDARRASPVTRARNPYP
jgi:hypothetical protein